MRTVTFILTIAFLFLLAACGSQPTAGPDGPAVGQNVSVPGGSYTDVSVPELQGMLEIKDFVFVNVHIPFEGDMPETDLSIAYDEIALHLDQLPADKDAKIVLYCRSGNMSTQAARELVGLGYSNVWNLAGGFNAWKAAGLPMAGE